MTHWVGDIRLWSRIHMSFRVRGSLCARVHVWCRVRGSVSSSWDVSDLLGGWHSNDSSSARHGNDSLSQRHSSLCSSSWVYLCSSSWDVCDLLGGWHSDDSLSARYGKMTHCVSDTHLSARVRGRWSFTAIFFEGINCISSFPFLDFFPTVSFWSLSSF